MNDQAQVLRTLMANNGNGDIFSKNSNMKVITVASGKGGVGKSNFSVNLALALKELGKKPLILDADFGLANVEIILGERPKYNLSHVLNEQCSMQEIVTESKYGVSFISGGSGIKDMMFLTPTQIDKVGRGIASLEEMSDLLVVDTGAGINEIVLKFCRLAQDVYIIITPEPTSITDGYALIKTIANQMTEHVRVNIIVNKAASRQEAVQVFNNLQSVAKAFLKLEIQYAGFIPYDEKLFMAGKNQVPIAIYDQRAKSSVAYREIAKQICDVKESDEGEKRNLLNKFKSLFSH
ncbi:MinD/ParA family protein [Cellulosilyticum ruminicola]|uniref:MinD/ParA family protein n=1 Tax=Cellulosilyticum ruminicola TaxID=425254 RepID=UPI0006CF65C8|nr:MinD/ParA family protein [Cellulosilyticum ruminicola]